MKDWRNGIPQKKQRLDTVWNVPLEDMDLVEFYADCDCLPNGEERLDR